jgi:DNA-binding IclR family transcriptional regulator
LEKKSGVLDKSIDVLECLYEQGGSARICNIVEQLGYNKSTVFRILNTLKNRGYIFQNESDSTYQIGPKFSRFSQLYQENLNFVDMLKPYIKKMSEKYNECVNISVLDNSSLDYPAQISIYRTNQSSSAIGFRYKKGIASLCHASASGKCFLAFADQSYLDRYYGCNLSKYTEYTITNWDELTKDLIQIRKDGYATEHNEYEVGLTCIAVPILDSNNTVLASVSLTGSTLRIEAFNPDEIIKDLKQLAKKVY